MSCIRGQPTGRMTLPLVFCLPGVPAHPGPSRSEMQHVRCASLISLCCLRRSDVGPALPCAAFLVLVGVGVAWGLSVVRFRVYQVQRV
ncbi:hypothetical protein BDZ85DRAFT_262969 [Elsinoe ampelina]|uniref:Uncharacterized protein n=1 Tax=Elsinoe ampelina TaxID=302913 RepID=A0A6A6GBI7_9PEZI|nr:hypothetical protein BDZ85DRAFT_262969 [Elsinoe ampelina]